MKNEDNFLIFFLLHYKHSMFEAYISLIPNDYFNLRISIVDKFANLQMQIHTKGRCFQVGLKPLSYIITEMWPHLASTSLTHKKWKCPDIWFLSLDFRTFPTRSQLVIRCLDMKMLELESRSVLLIPFEWKDLNIPFLPQGILVRRLHWAFLHHTRKSKWR